MKKQTKQYCAAACLLAAFALWTAALTFVDVRAIGPMGSAVGFATINRFFHQLSGVHLWLYTVTDWLGLVPLMVALGFAVLGLAQWLRRKSICKVDRNILCLGGFYIVTIAAYLFFETVVINYRPVLINGFLEVSYPSSTTLLTMCVMPTAMMQLRMRIKNQTLRKTILIAIALFTVFMVLGRLISGVHWLSDIIGGALLSAGLVVLYAAVAQSKITANSH